MWLIKRVYMDGAGHEEAFYKGLTLDYIGLAHADAARSTPAKNAKVVANTYQQLVNGGGKSTYIALLLSVFEPSVNDFTQYLANRRQSEYHYRNYFHQELSVILVEMVNETGQTLLLGHAHQRRGDDVDRVLFICDAPDSLLGNPFDEVPSYSRAEHNRELRPYANSLHSFDGWLNLKSGGEGGVHWRKTKVNKEWRAFLLEQRINVDLIKTMVTFNSEEGGLTKFIDYKTEQDFLGAFFACTMSKDTTEQLSDLVAHEVERQGELEAIRRNESFLGDVLSNWRAFLEPARQLENAQTQQRQMDDGFREAMRDLTAFIEATHTDHARLDDQAESLQKEIDQITFHRDLQGKCKTLLEHDLALHQLNEQQANVTTLTEEAGAYQCQLQIARTAIDYKAYGKAQDAYRQAGEALKVFQSETEKPLQVIFERTAGEALGVLERAISGHRQQETAITEALRKLDTEIQSLRQSYGTLQQKLGGLESESKQCRQDKRKGESRRDALRDEGLILSGENPAVAQNRLESALQNAAQVEAQAKTDAGKAEQALEAHQQVVNQATVAQSQAQQALTQAKQKHQAALDSARALTESYKALPVSTQRTIALEDANWHNALCGSRIDEVLEAGTQTLKGLKQRLLTAQHELDELKLTGHELVAKQIKQALEAFYAAGIARDKLWAFPRYLTSAFNDDAPRIAAVIDQNPGRYLSLVALDDATFAQVRKISNSLPWKGVPVAIHRLDETRDLQGMTPDSVQVVLSNLDKYGYSQAAYEARLQELKNTVASQAASVEAAEHDLTTLANFKNDWRLHHDQHGRHWSSLIEQHEQAQLTLAQAEATLTQSQQHERTLRGEKATTQARFESAQQQREQAKQAHDTLIHFVDTEWASRDAAIIKLEQLAGQIQWHQETLGHQSDDLARKERAAASKRTESTHVSIQIGQWTNLRNEPLYSGMSASEGGTSRNPQDAHAAAAQAHRQLLEAAQGDQVMELKRQREGAEQAQRAAYSLLSTHSAYQSHPDAVKTAAISDQALINERIAQLEMEQQQLTQRQITAQATLQNRSDKYEKTCESLDEGFVWGEKPTEIEEIRAALADISAAYSEAKHLLNRLFEQQKFQAKKIEDVKERLQSAKTAQAMIQPITPTSAAGLPAKILNIAEYADTLRTQCQTYAQLKETLKQKDERVATVWGHFRKRIEEESAKGPDGRASQEYLQQLDSIATYHEVLGDLERVGTGITQVFEAVQDSLEQFQRSIDLTVTHLTAHLEGAIKLLKRAKSVRIPDDCPVLPGRPIVKMTDRLNDLTTDLRGFASARLQHWIAKGQIPRAPNRDAMTADLVQSVFGEGDLEVRLLKTNASRPQWTHITRLEGSGGQRLTSAFLLFVTVGKVREYDTGISSAGFLLADNPLGKSNADDLMRIQTQMAKAYNIQLIYLTGISDENAQSMFDNHLFLNKVQKLKRRDLVTVDNERHTLWAASLVAKPQPVTVL
ncbi:hypothetical protein BJK05_07020 [Pectobacterium polaris]|uniref:hypothetical protein n=1 Tax=Pectobacterium polaris TaxID=2042057 RepID=UPI000BAC685A|nr:hypothetical protein [Pectobacterium polaris]ASY79762.1 hypothetical protein BJK05_07020 [Pectobacterium polaris]